MNNVFKLITIQILYYIKSTQLVFFLIPLLLAFFGITTLIIEVVEALGLLSSVVDSIPDSAKNLAMKVEAYEENLSLIKFYGLVSLGIYIIEFIISKIAGRHIEINERFTYKHYVGFYTFGIFCLYTVFLGFAEVEGSMIEAVIVLAILYFVGLGILSYGLFITSFINAIIRGIHSGQVTFKTVKKK